MSPNEELELARRGIWAVAGFATPVTWLSWAVSMGSSTACEHVRVAAAARGVPPGWDPCSKVRAITRYGDPAAEELLLA